MTWSLRDLLLTMLALLGPLLIFGRSWSGASDAAATPLARDPARIGRRDARDPPRPTARRLAVAGRGRWGGMPLPPGDAGAGNRARRRRRGRGCAKMTAGSAPTE
jgi:hypothetical protein